MKSNNIRYSPYSLRKVTNTESAPSKSSNPHPNYILVPYIEYYYARPSLENAASQYVEPLTSATTTENSSPQSHELNSLAKAESMPYASPERKLFVGMLSKKCTENEIRNLFENFGTIEECTILRDPNGQSKGCAFVTYTSKQCAINAIRTMHQSHRMENCNAPLVVKFADTQKDKDQKKLQQMQNNIWNIAASMNLTPQSYINNSAFNSPDTMTQIQLLSQLQNPAPQITNGHANLNGLLLQNSVSDIPCLTGINGLSGISNMNGFNGLNGLNGLTGMNGHNLNGHTITDVNSLNNLQNLATLASLSAANAAAVNPIHLQNLISLAAITNASNPAISPTALTGLTFPTAGILSSSPSTLCTLPAPNCFAGNNMAPSLADISNSIYCSQPSIRELAALVAGKHIEGPDGANLFIYHLPQECTDLDLATLFLPYGNVISAKVNIDKHTNMSKCFGFVSYDLAASAQNAIKNMNGFQLGPKRLKVQLKRPKDTKPY